MSWPPPNYNPDHGSGYKVTYDDFLQLLTDRHWRPAIARLLGDWFGYQVERKENETIVRTREGHLVDIPRLHAAIQSDARQQYELYQTAMNLWH
jgi:hypothetical protein